MLVPPIVWLTFDKRLRDRCPQVLNLFTGGVFAYEFSSVWEIDNRRGESRWAENLWAGSSGLLFSCEIIFAIVETMTFDIKLLPYPPTYILFGSNWTRPGRVKSGYGYGLN